MDLDSSTISPAKGDQVASIKDAPPSSSNNPQFHNNVFVWITLYLMGLYYLWVLALVRILFTEKKQSPFKTHGVLMITSTFAIITAVVTSAILLYAQKYLQKSWLRNIHFTILELTICYSVLLAAFSIMFVFCLPQNLVWIGYLVICLLSACYFTGCMCLPLQKIRYVQFRTDYLVLYLFPLPIMLSLHVPDNLSWIRVLLMVVSAVAAIIILSLKYVNDKKPKSSVHPFSS